jgi:tRNA modification GTPase
MIEQLKDTIAAIATPIGEGAISIIRVSGVEAVQQVSKRFKGTKNLISAKSHTAHHGWIFDSKGKTIDEVVCTVFIAPRSFTGENTVEISCHGGILVTRRVLESVLETGMRPAKPGEFTERAFLNGKIDLSQAEAIADLIKAQSDKYHRASLDQLEGTLSRQIHSLRDQLVKILGLLELELDFLEEGIELIDKLKIKELLKGVIVEIETLVNTYKYGKLWKDGVSVAIVGIPNVGKSSLLNWLLNEERAIVTNIPGTTRDFIEEKILIDGILFRIIDTAGIRETRDPIEINGLKRTWKIVEKADLILLVHDYSKKIFQEEMDFIKFVQKEKRKSKSIIVVLNKIDLVNKEKKMDQEFKEFHLVKTSALKMIGLNDLKKELSSQIIDIIQTETNESVTITNERHYFALLRAKEQITSSLESTKKNESTEFVALDIKTAIDSLGEIIGIITIEDVLNEIFSKFCIGK